MKTVTYLILILLGFNTSLYSQTNNDIEDATPIAKTRVRLVVLNTSDVTVTQQHIARLRDIGEYIEDFYVTQLTAKGYSLVNTDMFARNTDGDILIYMANSSQSSTAITNLTSTGINLAKAAYTDLTDLNTVWAIAHFKPGGGFVGRGSVNNGKMRFELKDATGSINFSKNMAQTNYHRDISLKAIHHELGHALTVLHNGPLRTNTMFNTMLGPINKAYENTVGITQTTDVQLSDYTAAVIAYHPIFKDSAFDISELNGKNIKIEKIIGDVDLFTVNCSTGLAHVRGKVTSNLPFHHIVIRFTYNNLGSGGYWNKSFAVVPDSNGIFDLQLTENDINVGATSQNDFEYEIMVAFYNGLSRGVNQLEVSKPITTSKNQFVGTYSFDIDISVTQNITLSGNTISTDYSGATSYQWVDCNNNNEPILGATFQRYTPISNGKFAVKIVIKNGCTHISSCLNLTTLGVYNIQDSSDEFKIYPNPSNGSFVIKPKNNNIRFIKIYSLSGQTIFQKEIRQDKDMVLIKSIKKGIYVLNIKTDKGSYNVKIISSE